MTTRYEVLRCGDQSRPDLHGRFYAVRLGPAGPRVLLKDGGWGDSCSLWDGDAALFETRCRAEATLTGLLAGHAGANLLAVSQHLEGGRLYRLARVPSGYHVCRDRGGRRGPLPDLLTTGGEWLRYARPLDEPKSALTFPDLLSAVSAAVDAVRRDRDAAGEVPPRLEALTEARESAALPTGYEYVTFWPAAPAKAESSTPEFFAGAESEPAPQGCTCPTNVLMAAGCRCGQMARERGA